MIKIKYMVISAQKFEKDWVRKCFSLMKLTWRIHECFISQELLVIQYHHYDYAIEI